MEERYLPIEIYEDRSNSTLEPYGIVFTSTSIHI